MKKRFRAYAMLAALAACIASLGANAETMARITIENFAFDPPALTVRVGDRIVFLNRDQVPHAVVGTRSGSEIFRLGEQLDTDETYSIVADAPGEIALGCGLHARMMGKITVTP